MVYSCLGACASYWVLQVSEARLIELLEQVSEQAEKKTKVWGLCWAGQHACLPSAAKTLEGSQQPPAPPLTVAAAPPRLSRHAVVCCAGHHPEAAGCPRR